MPVITKKRITDDIYNLLDKFSRTDEGAVDETWLSFKIDESRAGLIIKSYQENRMIDQSWLTDLGNYSFTHVNISDDPNVSYANCDISKATIPNVVSITSRFDSNIDLGIFSIMSATGEQEYTPYPLQLWKQIPADHIRSKFNYYFRINNALYVNKKVDKLRILAVLASPEDGYIVNSSPVPSGSIVLNTVYIVKGGQVIYNGAAYQNGDTLTGAAVATYTGSGTVYLKSQLVALSETSAYPVNTDMARQIVLEICTKEFGIESNQLTDVLNDSVDDEVKK